MSGKGDTSWIDRRIGAQLFAARVELGLSGFDVAAELRIASRALAAIEAGEERAGTEVLLRLCAGYGITLRDIFCADEA